MILEAKNVFFSYQKQKVLDDVSLNINKGDFVILIGPNGNGKTTLLKCLNKILKIKEGQIFINDKNINEYKTNDLAKMIGYVPQYIEFNNMTVFDAILMGRIPYIQWNATNEDILIVNDLIEKFHLQDVALKNVNELSGGERQKVAIARALALKPSILLFDEPTSNLDIKNQYETMDLIKEIAKENELTIIITMHDINLALRYGNHFMFIKNGKMIASNYKTEIDEKIIKEVFNFDCSIQEIDGNKIILPK